MVVKLRTFVSCVSGRVFFFLVFECCLIRESAFHEHRGFFLLAVTFKNRFLLSFWNWFVKSIFFVSFVKGRETLKSSFFVSSSYM